MENIDNARLRAYIIWMPTLSSDSKHQALLRSHEFTDSHLSYFWDPGFISGRLWQSLLKTEFVAWDTYFAYAPDATWNDAPTAPAFYMHQLGKLPPEHRLDAKVLLTGIRELLDSH